LAYIRLKGGRKREREREREREIGTLAKYTY
jgi:hypothetical protein